MNRKDITKVKISQMIILWTVEVVFLTTGCIRLAPLYNFFIKKYRTGLSDV